MTFQDAISLIDELRGRFDAPYSVQDKESIAELYSIVLGKRFVPTTCQQCYHDAVIELYLYTKNHDSFMKKKSKYVMRAGFIIQCPSFHKGEVFTNANLTDKIAEEYLKKFPKQKDYFDVVKVSAPGKEEVPDKEETQETEEVPEKEENEVKE